MVVVAVSVSVKPFRALVIVIAVVNTEGDVVQVEGDRSIFVYFFFRREFFIFFFVVEREARGRVGASSPVREGRDAGRQTFRDGAGEELSRVRHGTEGRGGSCAWWQARTSSESTWPVGSYLVLRHFDVFEDARAALVRIHPVEDGAAIGGAVRLRVPLVGRNIVSAVHL